MGLVLIGMASQVLELTAQGMCSTYISKTLKFGRGSVYRAIFNAAVRLNPKYADALYWRGIAKR
jgi:hypothetical protein